MNGGHKISSSGLRIVVFRVLIMELQDDSSYITFGGPCKGVEAFFFFSFCWQVSWQPLTLNAAL